jgi:hypothetical protein
MAAVLEQVMAEAKLMYRPDFLKDYFISVYTSKQKAAYLAK